jgi:uncharacterized protein DUF5667
MTKKILVTSLVFTLLLVGVASAQDVNNLPDAGITPDSSLYVFDGLFEKLSLMLTFNQEKKVAKELRYAEERLAEVQEMLQSQNIQKLEVGLRNYEKLMNKVQERLQDKSANKQVGEKAKENIKQRSQNHLRVLSEVYDNVPVQAKKGVESALKNSAKNYQQAALQLNEDAVQINQQLMQALSTEVKQQLQQEFSQQLQEMQQEQERTRLQQGEQNTGDQIQQQQQTQQQQRIQEQVQDPTQEKSGTTEDSGAQLGDGNQGDGSMGDSIQDTSGKRN